ncbi:hypothetical protein GJ688_18175 [Heliobacillus mobilis]|uniref:Lipoprotein n=1 Tax=Heliobacterium mobile TaxID=28064 RepID=A0A6I3SPA7_HELMO|nr:hypothetical protein [Heliobacterium mobile]MTV50861.1 hypothetical protein [Heliobacterium mobile]
MKSIAIIISGLTLATFLLIGCSKTEISSEANPIPITMNETHPSTTLPNSEEKKKTTLAPDLLTLIDDKFISRYIEGLDICLAADNELIFKNSEDIPSHTLYIFSIYAMEEEFNATHAPSHIGSCGDRFFDKRDKLFHIPVETIREVLDKYFEKTIFEPQKVYDLFDPVKNEFVTPIFAGFGGARNPKLSHKEQITTDTVRLTVDFHDSIEPDSDIMYTKVYTMKHTDGGWKYLSITK